MKVRDNHTRVVTLTYEDLDAAIRRNTERVVEENHELVAVMQYNDTRRLEVHFALRESPKPDKVTAEAPN